MRDSPRPAGSQWLACAVAKLVVRATSTITPQPTCEPRTRRQERRRVVARRAPRTCRILNQVKVTVVKLGDLCALVGSVALSDSRSGCECRGAQVGLVRSSLSSGPAAVGRSASGAQAATGSVRRGLPARLGTCHVHARIHGAGGPRLSASEPERPGVTKVPLAVPVACHSARPTVTRTCQRAPTRATLTSDEHDRHGIRVQGALALTSQARARMI